MPDPVINELPNRCESPTAKVIRLAYLRVERPDLDLAEAFLKDFGLETTEKTATDLYMRADDGYSWCYHVHLGKQSRFVGMGFDCTSRADLDALAGLADASPVEPVTELGNGERVVLTDPNGFRVEVNWGARTDSAPAHRPPHPINGSAGPDRVNATRNPPPAPPEIVKLGHLMLETACFNATTQWYCRHLGFIPSDTQVLPSGEPAVCFLRMNLGDDPSDHHTLAIAHTFRAELGHAAFEVVDIDAIGAGQQHLRNQGWSHSWGIGRHVLGSQLFDYWSDPWGTHHEHYADGDMFQASVPTGVHPVAGSAMAIWGQPMPDSFARPSLALTTVITLIKNLWREPELRLKKLAALGKAMQQ